MGLTVRTVVFPSVIVWFSLTGLLLSATIARAEDALEGHRLFFTEAQRQAVEHAGPSASPGEPLKPRTQGEGEFDEDRAAVQSDGRTGHISRRSLDPVKPERRAGSRARERYPQNAYRIYFTALVTGQRGTQVLVNGLPCRITISLHPVRADVPAPVDCPGVQNTALSLTMSASHAELRVTDAAGRLYRLQPGEGL